MIAPYQRRPLNIGEIAENGILIAMAFGLNFIKIPVGATGGSINFQMLPLMIIALRRGPASGLICGGILFGLLTCLTDGYGFACYPFDYLIGFGSVAVMGFFRPFIFGQNQKGYNFKGEAFLLLAGVLSTFIRCDLSIYLCRSDGLQRSLHFLERRLRFGGLDGNLWPISQGQRLVPCS